MTGKSTDGVKVVTDTLSDIQRTGIAHCNICPPGDDEVDVSEAVESNDIGAMLEAVAEHGIEEHGLPENGHWTDEMVRRARERDRDD